MNIENVNFFLKQTLVSTKHDIDTDHIKAVERIVRNSYEYKKFLEDKRANLNENSCAYLKDFDFKKGKATLELHHVIFLWDLVEIAYNVLLDEGNKNITTSEVADLVLSWHYENIIPYVFLSKTFHELYHSGQYNFTSEDIKGDFQKFIIRYNKYLSQTSKENLFIREVE